MQSQFVAKIFGLPWNATMQDWELESADPSRLSEFVEGLETISEDAKVSLAELIMASFEESVTENTFEPELWERYCRFLDRDLPRHAPMLSYWSDVGAGNDTFAIEPYIKKRFQLSF